jgi:hypothetical protein
LPIPHCRRAVLLHSKSSAAQKERCSPDIEKTCQVAERLTDRLQFRNWPKFRRIVDRLADQYSRTRNQFVAGFSRATLYVNHGSETRSTRTIRALPSRRSSLATRYTSTRAPSASATRLLHEKPPAETTAVEVNSSKALPSPLVPCSFTAILKAKRGYFLRSSNGFLAARSEVRGGFKRRF